mgnify:CR=1 FL=1
MYNLYIHQKKLLDLEKSSNEKKSLSKNETKRKKKINSLTKNYNERMKNFVMNLCKDPIILGQNDIEIHQAKSEKNNEKLEKRNHFIFGNYMTDKEKVEILNQEREVLNKIEEMNKNYQKKRDIINARKNNCDILIQPRMKFGPRQEIENLIDNINKNGVNHIFVSRKYNKIVSEYLKKLKDNNVKYVKGYDILKNSYGDNYNDIKNLLSKDENKENEYLYKNVISSKLSNNNNIKEYKNKKIKIMEYKDSTKNKFYMPITKKISSLQNNFKSNELKKMFNDNRKMYFNGASQFINLKLVKPKKKNHLSEDEISVIYTDKNIYFKKINENTINKNNNEHGNRLSRQQSMPNILNDNSKINNKIFTPINQNQNSHESYINKYLNNLPKNSNKNQLLEENLFSNENYDNVQGLCEESKIKRIKMNSLINKEINKSIIKNYIDKYDIINEFNKNNVINTNNLFFQSGNHIIEKVDDNLGGKLKYLIKVIQRRNQELMKENNSNVHVNSGSHFKILNKNEKKKKRKFANNDYMLIDGQFIAKNDIKTLSDVMFTKCNFYRMKKSHSQRNFFKNEEKFEKKQGLNVNNFYSKMGT